MNMQSLNAFFIWIDKDNYKLIGLDDNDIIVLNNNSYKLENNYLLNLKLFWGNGTLIIDTNSLKFGNYKKVNARCILHMMS